MDKSMGKRLRDAIESESEIATRSGLQNSISVRNNLFKNRSNESQNVNVIWHNVKNLPGFRFRKQMRSVSREREKGALNSPGMIPTTGP